jgi:hypothetical protein
VLSYPVLCSTLICSTVLCSALLCYALQCTCSDIPDLDSVVFGRASYTGAGRVGMQWFEAESGNLLEVMRMEGERDRERE